MNLFESIFDLTYLTLVIALGLRLLFSENRQARLFGWMGILLGLGDSFHLIPRVMSHLSAGGPKFFEAALSYGELVTSLTMTVFYLLYWYWFKQQARVSSRQADVFVWLMVFFRAALVLLPQNEWGSLPGNYGFALLRNLPFLFLGIFLIYESYQKRSEPSLRFMWWLISLSFLFYLPVVVGARFVPALGAFMMPKTVAYLAIVWLGFRYYNRQFGSESLFELSVVSMIFGLAGGVFYREVTKLFAFIAYSTLSVVHVHLIGLGFLFFLLLFSLVRRHEISALRYSVYGYTVGLLLSTVMFVIRGLQTVLGGSVSSAAISGLAGLGHILLGVSMVLIVTKLRHVLRIPEQKKTVAIL